MTGCRLRAVVFDFDGTLVNTESAEYEAWQEEYADRGCELSFELWSECIGTSDFSFDVYAHLSGLCGEQLERSAVRRRWLERFRAKTEALEALPGVRDWVEQAQASGVRLGIASCSHYQKIHDILVRLGLRDAFDAVSSWDAQMRSKPHPEVYIRALGLLGVSADEALAVEDSPHGATAAAAAGLFCVVVPNGMTTRLAFPEVELVGESLAQLPFGAVVEAFRQGAARSALGRSAGADG